jgi:hypothetical protein
LRKKLALIASLEQGCQMVYFQTKNPNLGKCLGALEWKRLAYYLALWNILRLFGTFYGHFGNSEATWYYFTRFGVLCQEKSGNPGLEESLNCLDKLSLLASASLNWSDLRPAQKGIFSRKKMSETLDFRTETSPQNGDQYDRLKRIVKSATKFSKAISKKTGIFYSISLHTSLSDAAVSRILRPARKKIISEEEKKFFSAY